MDARQWSSGEVEMARTFARDDTERDVFRFCTTRGGVERTIGLLVELDAKDRIERWPNERAQLVVDSFHITASNAAVAKGKVAIVEYSAGGAMSAGAVFQSAGGQSRRADCGNAAAAIAFAILRHNGSAAITFALHGTGSRTTTVTATIAGAVVRQAWRVPTTTRISSMSIDGRRAIEIDGLFNHYVIINAVPDDPAINSIVGGQDPLHRVAAVDFRSGLPTVAFYTSGTRHPSAPLTGLAVLAFLAKQVRWLEPLAWTSTVVVNGKVEPLPTIAMRPDEVDIELPETGVTLEPVPSAVPGHERAA